MANMEKHPQRAVEQIEQADASEVPTCARSPLLIGQYIKDRRRGGRAYPAPAGSRGQPVILRLDDVPATPHNLERMEERIRELNRLLAASGTPVRLRVV
jgi:hypothetical protein